jgi:hypothetical protein
MKASEARVPKPPVAIQVRTSPVSSIKIALDWDAPLWLSSVTAEVGSTGFGAGDAIVLAAKKLLIDCFVDGAAVGCAIVTHYQTAQSIHDDRRCSVKRLACKQFAIAQGVETDRCARRCVTSHHMLAASTWQ